MSWNEYWVGNRIDCLAPQWYQQICEWMNERKKERKKEMPSPYAGWHPSGSRSPPAPAGWAAYGHFCGVNCRCQGATGTHIGNGILICSASDIVCHHKACSYTRCCGHSWWVALVNECSLKGGSYKLKECHVTQIHLLDTLPPIYSLLYSTLLSLPWALVFVQIGLDMKSELIFSLWASIGDFESLQYFKCG